MKKRGQAAAFIIIGLIILIIIIGFIAVKKGFLQDLFDKISTERRTIPQQVRPLQDFLDSCVSQVTSEAINLAALQGGYINLPDDPIPSTPFTPLGPTLEIIPDSDFKTAVWFRERGNGIQEINVPTEQNIENELAGYISSNFGRCVANLTEFEDQGFVATASAVPRAIVELTEGRISSSVDYPINIKIADTNFTLSEHRADIDTEFGKLYKMAKEIIEAENEGYFLENKTIDTLVAYDPEVPFSGTDLSCSEKIWFKDDVERRLKNILFENVAAMHIKDTNYELQDDKFKYLEFDALETKDDDITVNLMYIPNWPTLIEITPSEGNILRSDQIIKKAGGPVATLVSSFFCLNQHRFVYDIKYPVLVTLRDPSGLTFQYATQVIIDNNQPRENRLEILDLPDTTSPICQYPQKEVSIFTGTLDPQGELVPLDTVTLSFKCFPASCPLGTSKVNTDGEPVLTTTVPLCFNGILEGYKPGYKQVQDVIYSSNEPETPPISLVILEQIYTKPVNIFVIEKETGAVRGPYGSEQINFQFIHKEATYQTNYIYPNENNTVELLPGNYIVNLFILRNSSTYKITIPKETIENCIDTRDFGLLGFFGGEKQVCNTMETDPMEFETILTGGATEVEHEFTRQELASEAPLNLYVLSSNIPGNLEDLQKIQIEVETNKEHPLFRAPEVA